MDHFWEIQFDNNISISLSFFITLYPCTDTSFIHHVPKTCKGGYYNKIIRCSMLLLSHTDTDDLFSYQFIIIVSLALAVLLLISVLTTVVLYVCISHKRIRGE